MLDGGINSLGITKAFIMQLLTDSAAILADISVLSSTSVFDDGVLVDSGFGRTGN